MWRPKSSHNHFTIRLTYPDKCFVLFIIKVTYPVIRATYLDKEVKRLHWEALLFTAPPAGSLRKFTSPVKEAALTGVTFTGQPAGGRWAQGLINRSCLYLTILFLFLSSLLNVFIIITRK